MKLSELVYEIVRDSISLPNTNFNYASFINGEYSDKKDYRFQIAGVFNALNLGLSRLYSYDKIPYSMLVVNHKNSTPLPFDKALGEVISVARLSNNGFERLKFRILNIGNKQEIHIFKNGDFKVYVEYKKSIPQFSQDDIKKMELDIENELRPIDTNIDLLSEYNITNEMCNYLKEFAKSIILENIAPELANNHNIRAEQYLNGIADNYSQFLQTGINIE